MAESWNHQIQKFSIANLMARYSESTKLTVLAKSNFMPAHKFYINYKLGNLDPTKNALKVLLLY